VLCPNRSSMLLSPATVVKGACNLLHTRSQRLRVTVFLPWDLTARLQRSLLVTARSRRATPAFAWHGIHPGLDQVLPGDDCQGFVGLRERTVESVGAGSMAHHAEGEKRGVTGRNSLRLLFSS
jgi:hypothetical protein